MPRVLNAAKPAQPERQLCCWPRCNAYLEDLRMPLCDVHVARVYNMVKANAYDDLQHDMRLAAARRAQDYAAQAEATGYVYFVRFGNRVKIGYSSQPRKRFGAIPHDEVLAVIPGSLADEHALHLRFAHLSEQVSNGRQREWFRIAPDLIQFLAEVKAQAA